MPPAFPFRYLVIHSFIDFRNVSPSLLLLGTVPGVGNTVIEEKKKKKQTAASDLTELISSKAGGPQHQKRDQISPVQKIKVRRAGC